MTAPVCNTIATKTISLKGRKTDTLSILAYLQDVGFDLLDSVHKTPERQELQEIIAGMQSGSALLQSSILGGEASFLKIIQWVLSRPTEYKPEVLRCASTYIILGVGDGLYLYMAKAGIGKGLSKLKLGWCSLYGTPQAFLRNADWINQYPNLKKKKAIPQVGIVVQTQSGITTKYIDMPKVLLKPDELDLSYGAGMGAFHQDLVGTMTKTRSGLTIFYGPPGGGKTTYIRHLIWALRAKKNLILMPKAVLPMLGTPQFITYLVELKGTPTVLVLEDAEDVVTSEARSQGSATSTLLNLTDGILNDICGTQVILTFNCPLVKVDSALLRSGRLIGKREFGPLTASEARKFAEHKKLASVNITGPTMLCDIVCLPPVGTDGGGSVPVARTPIGF